VKKYAKAYDYVLVPIISPYEEIRNEIKNKIGENQSILLHIIPLETCIQRDVKGLYKKLKLDLIKNHHLKYESYFK